MNALTPLSKSQPDKWKRMLKKLFISAAVCGIEFCYAAETVFVTPLLMRLGVPVYLTTMCWTMSPLLGFFLVPILGSASDSCTSPLGRRRPFIILYSVGIIIGLVLVPYGENIGRLLGDERMPSVSNANGSLQLNATIDDANQHSDLLSTDSHPIGMF